MTFEDMNSLREFLKTAHADGADFEEIAKMVSDTLNTLEAEEAEKNKADDAKNVLLDEAEYELYCAYDNSEYDFDTIYSVCLLVAAKKCPDWTIDELEAYGMSVANGAEMTMEVSNMEPEEAIKEFCNKLFGFDKGDGNIRKTVDKIANSGTVKGIKSDADIIKDFLKSL